MLEVWTLWMLSSLTCNWFLLVKHDVMVTSIIQCALIQIFSSSHNKIDHWFSVTGAVSYVDLQYRVYHFFFSRSLYILSHFWHIVLLTNVKYVGLYIIVFIYCGCIFRSMSVRLSLFVTTGVIEYEYHELFLYFTHFGWLNVLGLQ